jgi:hypothetical protein
MLAVVLLSAARKNSVEEEERRVEKSARLDVMDIFELSEILISRRRRREQPRVRVYRCEGVRINQ